jgi:hypothetical protein
MFATLLGELPAPSHHDPDNATGGAVGLAIRAQEAAGLEPVTDGRLDDPGFARLGAALGGDPPHVGRAGATEAARAPALADARRALVDQWRAGAALTDRAFKQALPGPYSVALRAVGDTRRRNALTLRVAESIGGLVKDLGAAGCSLVEVEEAEAHRIAEDRAERRLFLEAHEALIAAAGRETQTHLSLSIVGGSAAGAGTEAIVDLAYASLAVDLIAGPDNWNLVTRLAGDRGVIAGVLSAGALDEPREVMVWAAHYAASSRGRGLARVGLGSAGSWANLTWEAAVRKMGRLGQAARLASMPPSDELARSLDPKAVSSRRAALGHGAPKPRGRRA